MTVDNNIQKGHTCIIQMYIPSIDRVYSQGYFNGSIAIKMIGTPCISGMWRIKAKTK